MIVLDGATHSQNDGVEGNGDSLKDGAGAFVLFLRGAQLVLRSSVLTVLDLDELSVTLDNAEIFGSVLLSGKVDMLVAGGAPEELSVPLSCTLPLRSIQPPPLLAVCYFLVLVEMGAIHTASRRR